ncbi:hypothetical protein K438DRAFT_1972670 [Mycena galopus ATCC 62051]|nr:hypothetical protein K438DRAFT_1972670 [Mycena galopus ATCC 62051]
MPCAPPLGGGPRLPTEIVDQVLKKLNPTADEHTLRRCGLVSHTWLVLSRTILFYSISVIRVKPHNDFWLKAFNGATIRPYVRDVHLGVDPIAEWTETHLPKLLSRFPELTTLRMTYHLEMLFQFEIQVELEHLLLATPRRGIVARISRALSSFACWKTAANVQSTPLEEQGDGCFIVPACAPLANLRTVYLDYLL